MLDTGIVEREGLEHDSMIDLSGAADKLGSSL